MILIDKYEEIYKRLKTISEVRNTEITEKQKVEHKFNIGDRVYISSLGTYGIVYELEDGKGDIGVMVKKKKLMDKKYVKGLSIKLEK